MLTFVFESSSTGTNWKWLRYIICYNLDNCTNLDGGMTKNYGGVNRARSCICLLATVSGGFLLPWPPQHILAATLWELDWWCQIGGGLTQLIFKCLDKWPTELVIRTDQVTLSRYFTEYHHHTAWRLSWHISVLCLEIRVGVAEALQQSTTARMFWCRCRVATEKSLQIA